MLTRKQISFLKHLNAHKSLTYDEIKCNYSEEELVHTFDTLLHEGYIDNNRPPITVIDHIPSKPCKYFLSDKGINALEQVKDQQQGFIRRLFVDKVANVLVSAIVAFITAVITYIIMPHIISLLSWG